MALEFYPELREALNSGRPFVLCTVVETIGSSPGTVGQKMIVWADGRILGSVGGGTNEERVRQTALEIFKSGGSRMMSFDLANPIEGADPICGGEARVFLELMADRPRLVIFGGGHIGHTLARLAHHVKFHVTLVDERPAFCDPAQLPEVDRCLCQPFAQAMPHLEIDAQTMVVVVTPGHTYDRVVVEQAFATPARYIGLVGSAKKIVEMKRLFRELGVTEERLENSLFTPVGINLGSTSPEEIAVEILAQLVAFRNGRILRFQK
jgi:xanthine dehydrogenase accessory factor